MLSQLKEIIIASPLEQFLEILYLKPAGNVNNMPTYTNPTFYFDNMQVTFTTQGWLYSLPLHRPNITVIDKYSILRHFLILFFAFMLFVKQFKINKNVITERDMNFLIIVFTLVFLFFKRVGLFLYGYVYAYFPVYIVDRNLNDVENPNLVGWEIEKELFVQYRTNFYEINSNNINYTDILSAMVLSMLVIIVFSFFLFLFEATIIYAGGITVFVQNRLFYFQRNFYKLTAEILGEVVKFNVSTQNHIPFVFGLFSFLFIANLIGMLPYNFTITSHFINTLLLSMTVLVVVFITTISNMGIKTFLSNVMPPGTPLVLGYLLIPIEIISYFFRVLSLSVRLFANIMAGHTLLKVILGFAWTLLIISENLFFLNIISMGTLTLLTVLELGVACIQAYVFTMLSCLYLNDAFNAH